MLKNQLHNIPIMVTSTPCAKRCGAVQLLIAYNALKFRAFANGSEVSTRFVSSAGMVPILTALKYILRCVVVNKVNKSGVAKMCAEPRRKLNCVVEENSYCGASFLPYCKSVWKMDQSWNSGMIRFSAWATHENCALFDRNELNLTRLKTCVVKLREVCRKPLKGGLLFGMRVTGEFETMCKSLQNNFSSRKKGLWFGLYPSNLRQICKRQSLLKRLLFCRKCLSLDL